MRRIIIILFFVLPVFAAAQTLQDRNKELYQFIMDVLDSAKARPTMVQIQTRTITYKRNDSVFAAVINSPGDTSFTFRYTLGNPQRVTLISDVINNNATANTMQDITGLSFPVLASVTYKFIIYISYTSAATTTGARFSINGPAFTFLDYNSSYSLTTTSRTFNEGLSTYNVPSASNASAASTGSNIAIIEGIIRPSASGTVIARFASEVLVSAITAKGGKSYVQYQPIN